MNSTSFTERTMSDGQAEVMVHQLADKSYSRVYAYASDVKAGIFPPKWQWVPGRNPLFVDLKTVNPGGAVRALCGRGFSFGQS